MVSFGHRLVNIYEKNIAFKVIAGVEAPKGADSVEIGSST